MRATVRVGAMVAAVGVLAVGCYKPYDFTNDDKADHVLVLANGAWRNLDADASAPPIFASTSGMSAAADYDGDGAFDAAVVLANGDWVTDSDRGTFNFPAPPATGAPSVPNNHYYTTPVPADYDGDHHADAAWYRDQDGMWFIEGRDPIQFGSGPTKTAYGVSGYPTSPYNDYYDQDEPVPADYDGDGTVDLATYNARSRVWKVRSSKTGAVSSVTMPGDKTVPSFPAPGDYDGLGHAQRALYTLSQGWWIDGHAAVDPFGISTDGGSLPPSTAYPAAADYDGDGRTDLSQVSAGGVWTTRSSADQHLTSYTIGSTSTGFAANFGYAQQAVVATFTLIAYNCRPPTPGSPSDC